MAKLGQVLLSWLETRWVAPAYAGGLLIVLAISFLGAAVNSMAGWLYAISGIMFAIAIVNIWLSPRSLNGLQVHRTPIRPISVGEDLTVEITLENVTRRPKVLLQVQDDLPSQLGTMPKKSIRAIARQRQHRWTYTCQPRQRGVYHWETLSLRTAAPFGLFWCRRTLTAPAHATVYPQILPLVRCPLVDQMGTSSGVRWQASRQSQKANEGLTRAVRPYRWGDPTRLIHWRTSARYGELRVRELEELTADNQILIGLDTSDRWSQPTFESAVIAAASLYTYGVQQSIEIALWMPHTGILQNKHALLSALAEIMPGKHPQPKSRLPSQSMIWLSSSNNPPQSLPRESQWVCWLEETVSPTLITGLRPALSLSPGHPLISQLEGQTTVHA